MNYEIEEIKKSIYQIGNSCHFDYLKITRVIFNSLSGNEQQTIKKDALEAFFELFPSPKATKLKKDNAEAMAILFKFLLTKDNDVLTKLCSIL